MSSPENRTISQTLSRILLQFRGGDPGARKLLFEHVYARLHRMVRLKLRDFPIPHRFEQTDDVVNMVALRLNQALDKVEIQDARHLLNLSAQMIRRVLLDLARSLNGPEGMGRHVRSRGAKRGDERSAPRSAGVEDMDTSGLNPGRLAELKELQGMLEKLPSELREVVDCLFYNGLSQQEAAEVLGVCEKTVNRRWREARVLLGRWLRQSP